MDNLAAPTLPTQPQSAVQPTVSNKFLLFAAGLAILALGIAIGLFTPEFLNRSQNVSQLPLTPIPISSLTPTTAADPTADWKTYRYQQLFEIKIPNNLNVVDKGNNRVEVGDYFSIGVGPNSPEDCRGGCPIIDAKTSKTINGTQARYLTGWWGEIGGNIAQSYIEYVIPYNGKYIYLQMQELPFSTQLDLVREKIGKVSGENYKLLDQILSTFKFTDTETVETPIKNIIYKKTPGWSDFRSNTGYSLQIPPGFSDADGSGEEFRDGVCFMFFGNNAGGIISAKVVPYSGGSRRQLYGIQPGYDYRFEEVLIQNSYKSLIIEAGPPGDSGSGSGIVIPVGNNALIVSRSNEAKDNPEFNSLIQSIKIDGTLDRDKCGK